MIDKQRLVPHIASATALALLLAAARAGAQKSHDALAYARHHAKQQNQRVLLLLQGEATPIGDALEAALDEYRNLGKLVRYEYQLAAQPAQSLAARHLRLKLALDDTLTLPALIVLDTEDRVLGTLEKDAMTGEDDMPSVRRFLEEHKAKALDARAVLETGLALAKKTQRQTFVYLSAPW